MMQFNSSPHRQFEKSPHHQRTADINIDKSSGHKQRNGLAWWPGFLPFTLDASTLNTTRFQTAVNSPNTTVKYRTWRYYSSISSYYTDGSDNLVEVESSIELTLTFDSIYGDLSAATAQRIFSIDGVGDLTVPDYDYTWTRADGLFADSDIYPLITPDTAIWAYMSGSDVMIDTNARITTVTASGHETIPSSGVVVLDDTNLEWIESADYEPPSIAGTDGHYDLTTTITLSDSYTQLACANDGVTLLSEIPLSLVVPSISAIDLIGAPAGSPSLTIWRDPGTYAISIPFCFWEKADDLVTAGDYESGTNHVCRVKCRHAAGSLTLSLRLKRPEGAMVAYGGVNDEIGLSGYTASLFEQWSGIADWWDEPQIALAIRASDSLVNLATGLFDGNTEVPPTFPFPPVWYYDFETVVPQDSDGGVTAQYVGVFDVPASIRAFPIAELQSQLAAIGKSYGMGWLAENGYGSRPASPY